MHRARRLNRISIVLYSNQLESMQIWINWIRWFNLLMKEFTSLFYLWKLLAIRIRGKWRSFQRKYCNLERVPQWLYMNFNYFIFELYICDFYMPVVQPASYGVVDVPALCTRLLVWGNHNFNYETTNMRPLIYSSENSLMCKFNRFKLNNQ